MKKHIKSVFPVLTFLTFILLILVYSCEKAEVKSLGALPKADFTATLNADGHTVTLTNTTADPCMAYWAAPDLNLGFADLKGNSVKLNYIFPGTYKVKLLVSANGGIDSITKTITTTAADPQACDPSTAQGFISSCTEKTWKLNPAPNALWVTQFMGGTGANWWGNGMGEVTGRPCVFNDSYTFKFNATGDYIFDDKGDFYAEDYSGEPKWSCRESSTYPVAQKPWASGNFKYVVIPGGGVKGLGQLKVIGLGAHIGLQKPINNNETPNGVTATSITYDIWDMKHVSDNTGTYDLLTLTFHYGGWSATEGWWTYTLRSY